MKVINKGNKGVKKERCVKFCKEYGIPTPLGKILHCGKFCFLGYAEKERNKDREKHSQ